MKRWYVAQTHARAESSALAHLNRQGFTAYLPQFLKQRKHARRIDWVRAPLFPRYLFIQIDTACERWRAINSTVGISGLVSHGGSPSPLPDHVIKEIGSRENNDGLISINDISDFKEGDNVEILDGPFYGQQGLFSGTSDDRRVFILLNLLGRQVKVRTPCDAVAAIS